MTWLKLDSSKLADPFLAERFRRLGREIEERNREAKENPPASKINHETAPIISPRLRPFIDKIAAEMKAAQVEEDKLYGE